MMLKPSWCGMLGLQEDNGGWFGVTGAGLVGIEDVGWDDRTDGGGGR